MNPIYKFELTAGNTTQRAFPIYKDDLTKDFEKESNQEFFRAKLSGKLTFESDDYTFIVSQAFETQFLLEIFISYNAGQTWTSYWRGTFWKTDCEFDGDEQTVKVKPTVLDQYNDVLAGMDKEYNLIELAPKIVPVKADKRPMIQVYLAGKEVIGCFLSGMWWEQECEAVNESDTVEIEGQTINKLEWLHFTLNKSLRVVDVSQTGTPTIPKIFTGEPYERTATGVVKFTALEDSTGTEYNFVRSFYIEVIPGPPTEYRYMEYFYIERAWDGQNMWYAEFLNQPPQTYPLQLTLEPVDGSGATGTVSIYIHDLNVYSRYVCDTLKINDLDTYPIPEDDIVENNRNYHRVIGYYYPDTIYFSTRLTTTPNQWGLFQPDQYYQPPYLYWWPELFPVARNAWGRVSIWFTFSAFDWIVEKSAREPFTIRIAYPLASVISVLLAKIAPGITHEATTNYSQFLYGTNLIGITQTLLITPKSNLVTAGYDQPAQKAPITLKNVTDMLRDCFRCYWFIDEQNRFRVEHIQYFRNGGSYSGSPIVGIDLTTQMVPRNGKQWAFARNQYKFDKPEMAARYQFGWMDDVTQLFEGFPIDIISKYVNPDNIEQIDVSRFTSDIDYILLNPGEISKDGFVLLTATQRKSYADLKFIQGGVGITIGQSYNSLVDNSATRVHTGLMNITSPNLVVKNPSGYRFGLRFFDENENLLEYTTMWPDSQRTVPVPSGSVYVVLLVRNEAETAITPDVVNGLNGSISGIEYTLPYYNFVINGDDHILQNAYVAFCFLQQYYAYDMPAPQYEINGERMYAHGIKKLKSQTLRFPVLNDPSLVQLVKTNLGNGTIEKLSVNLSSRNANATLKYDTE